MEQNKLQSYLGFCIRARKIVYGAEDVESKKRNVFLLIMDEELGKSSLILMVKAQERFSCPLLVAKAGVLGEYLHRPAVKATAITDKHLAKAVCDTALSGEFFRLYSGGVN